VKPAFVFIGTSCSGKSTLSKRFADEFGLRRIDVVDFVLPLLPLRDAGEITTHEMLTIGYEGFFHMLMQEDFDVIEVASDDPQKHLPGIAEIVKAHDRSMIVVFTDASFDDCVERNFTRPVNMQVPVDVLYQQAQYDRAFFVNMWGILKCPLVFVDTSSARPLEESYVICIEMFQQFGLL